MSDVNKQMLEALKRIGGMTMSMYVSAGSAMSDAKRLANEAIAAADQAQQTELEPIGELRIVSGVMSGYSYPAASKYPEGTKLYAGQQQAEPVAWEVRNGVATHDFYRSEAEAEEVARDMQKSHDLSGSLAAFNVRPVYAHPPAAAVPDATITNLAVEHFQMDCDRLPGSVFTFARAVLAAAQKGGA